MRSGPSTHPDLRGLVIIPAFNERQSIGALAHRLQRALPNFDVLVIDDGSTDDTLRQVPAHAAVVSLPFNLGIGGAMQTGYRYAALHGYDVAVQVDGDGQHRPGEVRRLVGIGILSTLIRILSGLPITDCTSGFRVINRRVIQAFAHWYPDDYPEPEVILLLHRSGFKITELGVKMRQRRAGMTSIPLTRGLFYVLKVTTALLLDMAREPWPRKVTDHDTQPHPGTLRRNAAVPGASPIETVQAQGAVHIAVPDAGPSVPAPGSLAAGR
jgi:glycosyltransferase involved in cell wall biosynthesis